MQRASKIRMLLIAGLYSMVQKAFEENGIEFARREGDQYSGVVSVRGDDDRHGLVDGLLRTKAVGRLSCAREPRGEN